MPQTLVRHVTEAGRIRLGMRVAIKGGKHAGKPRPERLKHFRLTSNSKAALEVAARRYGGTVQAWTIPQEWRDEKIPPPEHTWELFTTSEVLDIVFHPGSVMTTSWEEWQGGYCMVRCNGQYIVKDGLKDRVGDPCKCPDDPQARKALARKTPPEACEEISRVAVFLEGIPLGQWRLETKGFYAPAEIRGLQDIMQACEVTDMLVRAQMRLEWRTDKKMEDGKPSTLIYPVVVLEPRQSADELIAIGEERRQRQIHPALERKQLAEHIEDLCGPQAPPAPRPLEARATVRRLLPAGEAGFEYIAQIEAAIARQPDGSLERSRRWAEKQFGKAQEAFTVEDYQEWLRKVREASGREPGAKNRQQGAQNAPGTTNAPKNDSQDSPPLPDGLKNDPEASGSLAPWREIVATHWEAFLACAEGDDTLGTGELMTQLEHALGDLTTADSVGQQLAAELLRYLDVHKEEGAQ